MTIVFDTRNYSSSGSYSGKKHTSVWAKSNDIVIQGGAQYNIISPRDFIPLTVSVDIDGGASTDEDDVVKMRLDLYSNSSRTSSLASYTFDHTGGVNTTRYNNFNIVVPASGVAQDNIRTIYWKLTPIKAHVTFGTGPFGTPTSTLSYLDMTTDGSTNVGSFKIPLLYSFETSASATRAEITNLEYNALSTSSRELNLKVVLDPYVSANKNNITLADVANDVDVVNAAAYFKVLIVRTNGQDNGNINNPSTWNQAGKRKNKLEFTVDTRTDNNDFTSFTNKEATSGTPSSSGIITKNYDIKEIISSYWFKYEFDVKVTAYDHVDDAIDSETFSIDNDDVDLNWLGFTNSHPNIYDYNLQPNGALPILKLYLKSNGDSASNSFAKTFEITLMNQDGDQQIYVHKGYNSTSGNLRYYGASTQIVEIPLDSNIVPQRNKTYSFAASVKARDNLSSQLENKSALNDGSNSGLFKVSPWNFQQFHSNTSMRIDSITNSGVFVSLRPYANASGTGTFRTYAFGVNMYNSADLTDQLGVFYFDGIDGNSEWINKRSGNLRNILNEFTALPSLTNSNYSFVAKVTAINRNEANTGNVPALADRVFIDLPFTIPKHPSINFDTTNVITGQKRTMLRVLNDDYTSAGSFQGGKVTGSITVEALKIYQDTGSFPKGVRVQLYRDRGGPKIHLGDSQEFNFTSSNPSELNASSNAYVGTEIKSVNVEIDVQDFKRIATIDPVYYDIEILDKNGNSFGVASSYTGSFFVKQPFTFGAASAEITQSNSYGRTLSVSVDPVSGFSTDTHFSPSKIRIYNVSSLGADGSYYETTWSNWTSLNFSKDFDPFDSAGMSNNKPLVGYLGANGGLENDDGELGLEDQHSRLRIEALNSSGGVLDSVPAFYSTISQNLTSALWNVNKWFHISDFKFGRILDSEGRNNFVGELTVDKISTSESGQVNMNPTMSFVDLWHKGDVKIQLEKYDTTENSPSWTLVHEETILDIHSQGEDILSGPVVRPFILRSKLASDFEIGTVGFRARVVHYAGYDAFSHLINYSNTFRYSAWAYYAVGSTLSLDSASHSMKKSNTTAPLIHRLSIAAENFPASGELQTCEHISFVNLEIASVPQADGTLSNELVYGSKKGQINIDFASSILDSVKDVDEAYDVGEDEEPSVLSGQLFSLSGYIKEFVVGSVVNSDGTIHSNNQSDRVGGAAHVTQLLDNSNFRNNTFFNKDVAVDHNPALEDEAMYVSDIEFIFNALHQNDNNFVTIYENSRDLSSTIIIDPYSIGGDLPKANSSFTVERIYHKDSVTMNDISEYNMIFPINPVFEDVSGSLGEFQTKKISFELPDIDSYYVNSNPKMMMAIRLRAGKVGFQQPNLTTGYYDSDNIVFIKPNGNEHPIPYEDIASISGAEYSNLRQNGLIDLRTEAGKSGNSYELYANISYNNSVYKYQDDNFDTTKNLYHVLYFYLEDEVTISAHSATPYVVSPYSFNQIDDWRRNGTVDYNLYNTISNYGHLEKDDNLGFVDTTEFATFNSFSYIESSLTVTTADLQFVNNDIKKMPFSFSQEIVKYDFDMQQVGGGQVSQLIHQEAEGSGVETFGPSGDILDIDGYTVENDVNYTVQPVVFSRTDFGASIGGVVDSKPLQFSEIATNHRQITNNYYEDFVPDFVPPFQIDTSETLDISVVDAELQDVKITFIYNPTAFTDAVDYFNISHENVTIIRSIVQGGVELTEAGAVEVVYSGDIFSLNSTPLTDGSGNLKFTFIDNDIDPTSIGGGFDPETAFLWKYTITPGLSYTPGGVTERISNRDSVEQSVELIPVNLSLVLPNVYDLEYEYNKEHSITVIWKYSSANGRGDTVDNDSVKSLWDFGENIYFDIYWRAHEESEQEWRTTSSRGSFFSRLAPTDRVKDSKYSRDLSNTTKRVQDMSDWKKSGTLKMLKEEELTYSHVIEYDKLPVKYGISIAVITRTSQNSIYKFASQNINTHYEGPNTIGIDQRGEGVGVNEGILVDPPRNKKIKVHKTENEMKNISDKITKRNLDFEDDLLQNISQVPISVTRRKAKIRKSDKPYDSKPQ